jgi:hypothetical protein
VENNAQHRDVATYLQLCVPCDIHDIVHNSHSLHGLDSIANTPVQLLRRAPDPARSDLRARAARAQARSSRQARTAEKEDSRGSMFPSDALARDVASVCISEVSTAIVMLELSDRP